MSGLIASYKICVGWVLWHLHFCGIRFLIQTKNKDLNFLVCLKIEDRANSTVNSTATLAFKFCFIWPRNSLSFAPSLVYFLLFQPSNFLGFVWYCIGSFLFFSFLSVLLRPFSLLHSGTFDPQEVWVYMINLLILIYFHLGSWCYSHCSFRLKTMFKLVWDVLNLV